MPPGPTEHLVFRALDDSDVAPLLAVFGDERAMRFLPAARVSGADQMRMLVAHWTGWEKRLGYSPWAVCSRQTGELLGDAGLMPYDGTGPDVEVVGHLLMRRWTRALVIEAATAILGFAFADLRLSNVMAAAASHHLATRRVLNMLGFTFRHSVALRAPLSERMDVFELSATRWLARPSGGEAAWR
jgi:ribosomal-protein-alanine N-acetyltransferase